MSLMHTTRISGERGSGELRKVEKKISSRRSRVLVGCVRRVCKRGGGSKGDFGASREAIALMDGLRCLCYRLQHPGLTDVSWLDLLRTINVPHNDE